MTASAPVTSRGTAAIVVPLVVGSAVAVVLGVFGSVHEPQFFSVNVPGFASFGAVKSTLASVALALGLVQVGSALVMYGKFGDNVPTWIGPLHVWSGRVAVLATIPVAVHCLYAFGLATGDSRVYVHSIVGCYLYGVFVAKMLILTRKTVPGWILPLLGGLLFTSLVVMWWTSALWFFQTGNPIF